MYCLLISGRWSFALLFDFKQKFDFHSMEDFGDRMESQERAVESDWQDFGDHVRAEEDRKARVLSSIQSAMRERLDSSVGLSDMKCDDGHDEMLCRSSGDMRGQLFEGIPDPYPHSTKFQRVIISESGEDLDSDTVKACKVLETCMGLREKWLAACSPVPNQRRQDEPPMPSPTADGNKGFRRRPGSVYNIFDRKVPETSDNYSYMMSRGVFEVKKIHSSEGDDGADCVARSFEDFIADFITVSTFALLLSAKCL